MNNWVLTFSRFNFLMLTLFSSKNTYCFWLNWVRNFKTMIHKFYVRYLNPLFSFQCTKKVWLSGGLKAISNRNSNMTFRLTLWNRFRNFWISSCNFLFSRIFPFSRKWFMSHGKFSVQGFWWNIGNLQPVLGLLSVSREGGNKSNQNMVWLFLSVGGSKRLKKFLDYLREILLPNESK